MSDRLVERESWLQGRLDWIERRWGSEFKAFVAWHHAEWGHLEAAEVWAGICWGLIASDGAHDLDEAAALADLREEQIELLAQTALRAGF